jgi:tetratricopeptide (TPR) repeat protein
LQILTSAGNKSEEFSVSFSLADVAETNHFVARETELAQIRNILCGDGSRRVAVLHGLGGIGKTQLTVAYAKRYQHNYSAVFWLNIKDIDSLKQSFAKVAKLILRDHPLASQLSSLDLNGNLDEVVEAVKAWLSLPKNTRWLLVYDNYDNPKIPGNKDPEAINVRKFFPESYQGSIIITTRLAQVKVGHQIPIKKLTNIEDSLQILANASGRELSLDGKGFHVEFNKSLMVYCVDPDAVKLIEKLDGLPLALATAGAYLSQVATTLSEYLTDYEASWLELQETSPEVTEYEDRMLYTTWQISYDHIQQQNDLSAKLLRLWAYLDNQDVWLELLQHTDDDDPEWIREITKTKLRFSAAIRVLCDHGLVEVDQSPFELVESRGYSMHGCVHAWTIHVLNQNWDDGLARMALSFVGSHIPEQNKPKWWATQRRLLQHASRCSNMINKEIIADDGMEWAMHMLGYLYADQGKLDEAEKMLQRALRGYEKAWGPDHTSTLDTVNNLGNLYADQGKLDEAEKMLQRALRGKEKAWGPDHTSTLNVQRCSSISLLKKRKHW